MKDEVVEEVRRVREQNSAKWNFDLKAILSDARQSQATSGHPVATFAAGKEKTP